MRYAGLATMLSLSILAPCALIAQEAESPSIARYELVSEQRVSATESYRTYRAVPLVAGRHAAGLNAIVTPRNSANFSVVSGQNRLHFPASTGRVRGDDTFTLRVDPSLPFNLADLQWDIVDPQAPLANAGRSRTVRVGETVFLDAGRSANPADRGHLSYRWSVSRPDGSSAVLSDETSIHPSFPTDLPGEYLATLTVTNEAGISSTSRVRYSTRNSAPVAHAGSPQTAAPGSIAILNGARSWDADGDALTFHWRLVGMPRGSNAVLLDSDSASPRLRLDLPGSYLAQLVVNDGHADSAASTVSVSTDNTAPVADAGSDRVAAQGSIVELSGAPSTDVDGDPLTYEWTLISAPPGSDAVFTGRSHVNPKLLTDRPGTYVAQLKVNDGRVDSEPVTVTITTDATLPPVANAGRNQSAVPGAVVRLDGSSMDPQGLPVNLRWALTSRPAGSRAVLSEPDGVSPLFVADVPGAYIAQLLAHNGVLQSAPSTVIVATANTPPVADAGPERTVVAGASVTLDAGGSWDADHHTLQHSWAILSRPPDSKAALSSSTGPSPRFTPDLPGVYVVQLAVSDGWMNSPPVTAVLSASMLSVTTTSLPVAFVGVPYSQVLTADGGTPPYFWSISRGRLPSGFTLNPNGTLSGTSQSTPSAFLTVLVTDSSSPALSATAQFTIDFLQPVLTIVTSSLPAGQKNVPYSQTLAGANGTPPYKWSISSGGLPSGWSLNPSSGLVSGTTSAAVANSSVTIRLTDSAVPPSSTSRSFSIIVADSPLSITTLSLPDGRVSVPYSFGLVASGGAGTLSWQLTAGTLPTGLNLSPAGVISGTPTTAASAVPLSFKVTDSSSPAQSATANLALTISTGLSITTSSLPNATVGNSYSFALSAAGGQGTLNWQLTAGTLPAGLSLNSATGQITGTPASPSAAVPLTFKVTDTASHSASADLSLTVLGGILTITTTSLPEGLIGLPYSAQLTATGGAPPYHWSVASGRIPGGYTFDESTGMLGGSPTYTDPAFVIFRVTDSVGQTATIGLSFTSNYFTFAIVTNALPNGQVGVPYAFQLQGIGGVVPYAWLVTSGTLPAGLSLNSTTGVISGTPSLTGNSRVTFRLIDSSPSPQFVNASLNLAITGGTFTITTPSLPNGNVGTAYSQTLTAAGGTGALTWQLMSGSLPSGLTLNPSSGQISGTPTATASVVPLTFKVTDSSSPAKVATASFTLTILGSALTITTPSLASGAVGSLYQQSLAASGGTLPYTWTLTAGTLPAGLTFNNAGQISGTAAAIATATPLTFKVVDAALQSASATFTLTIAAGPGTGSPLTVLTSSLPSAQVEVPYSQTLIATGGTLPYTWTVPAGRLPGGFSLTVDGSIVGTAQSANMPDGFLDPLPITFRVTDSSTPPQVANATLIFTIIKPALQILWTSPPVGVIGVPYSFKVQASGGGSGVYTWALTSGALPLGLSLDPGTGVISGIPTAAMVRRIVVSVTDPAPPPEVFGGSLQTVSASYTITIAESQ